MRISIITPAPARARNGNRNTASRWGRLLRELGHKVKVEQYVGTLEWAKLHKAFAERGKSQADKK